MGDDMTKPPGWHDLSDPADREKLEQRIAIKLLDQDRLHTMGECEICGAEDGQPCDAPVGDEVHIDPYPNPRAVPSAHFERYRAAKKSRRA